MAASGLGMLDEMIERCKALGGPRMPEEVAREAAPLVEAAVRRTASAGTTPLGIPWRPTKRGGKPLAHASEHVTATARGRFVVVTLACHDVFHHRGGKRLPRRQIIPDAASVGHEVKAAALAAARRVFARIMRGAHA